MANDNLRSINCKATHVWSQRQHRKGPKWYQYQHASDPNVILEIKEGKARKLTIIGYEFGQQYHMIAESQDQDGLHFDGEYEDSVDDKGDVHFNYYRNGTHHCFVGHYIWNGDGGNGYTGLYYIELEETERG